MEELTKTQIVLLTLLVSFVTSIATGIVTVALVDQSSQGVGQTIQTVVQRTIDTVIPTVATPEEAKTIASIVTTNKDDGSVQPSPTESDLMVAAVGKNSGTIVRIKKANTLSSVAFVALGVIVSPSGVLVTDRGLTLSTAKYIGVLPDGKEVALTPKIVSATSTTAAVYTFDPAGEKINAVTLGDSSKLGLGQRVLSLSGVDKDIVNIGIISSFDQNGTSTTKSFINTDFDTSNKPYGSILLNLAGEVIGIKTGNSTNKGFSYQSINALKDQIKQSII